MVSFFREKSSAGIFWLIALSLLLHVQFLFFPPQVILFPDDGFLYDCMKPLLILPSVALVLLYQSIIIIQALRLNYILNDLRMMQKPAAIVAMSYILITAFFPFWNNITPALLINSIIIWLIFLISKLYNAEHPKTIIYNIGLIAGCSILLYHPSISLALLVFLALAMLRPFRVNEWFVLFLGLLTPFYCMFAFLFLKDDMKNEILYLPKFQLHLLKPRDKISIVTTVSITTLLMFTGIYYWQKKIGRMVIQARKNWSVLLLMFLLFLPVAFLIKDMQFQVFLLCAVPVAAFVSNVFLYSEKRILSIILFWLSVAVIVYNNWILVKN